MSYVRVGIQGTSLGGEVWSINPTFDPSFEFPGAPDQSNLDDAALAIANLSPGSVPVVMLSTLNTLTGCRLEVRDDVTDELIGLSVQGRTTPLTGGATPKMPLQAAMVVSLRTNTPGASGRGRIYWPIPGEAVDSSGRIPAADITPTLASFKTYFNGMRSALATAFPTIGFDLAVRSKTTKTTPHVTRIQIGNVVDTQRRRRDKLVEAYQSTTFPT
jgi:hypothetical protein